MKIYFVYILYSEKFKKTYIGQTGNLSKRLKEHNSGKVKSTAKYRPFNIIHTEEFLKREEALSKEKYYKTFAGRKKINKLLEKAEMAELVDALDSKSSEAQTS